MCAEVQVHRLLRQPGRRTSTWTSSNQPSIIYRLFLSGGWGSGHWSQLPMGYRAGYTPHHMTTYTAKQPFSFEWVWFCTLGLNWRTTCSHGETKRQVEPENQCSVSCKIKYHHVAASVPIEYWIFVFCLFKWDKMIGIHRYCTVKSRNSLCECWCCRVHFKPVWCFYYDFMVLELCWLFNYTA